MKPLTETLPTSCSALVADIAKYRDRRPPPARRASPEEAEVLSREVATVFATFARMFMAKFERIAADAKAPTVWQRAFEAAGLQPHEIRYALERSSQLAWPPTVGEFIALAKFDEPSEEDAFRQAARWACGRMGSEAWSHPAVATAAARVGAWKLRFESEARARQLFAEQYRECISEHRRGRLEVREPTYALPSPEKSRPLITPEQRKRVKATVIADLQRFFGDQEPAR